MKRNTRKVRLALTALTLVAVLLAVFGAVSVWADTHYVSPTGSNTDPYTSPATAALRIQDAIDAASTGDVVDVAAGTYIENDITVTDKRISVVGAGSDATHLDIGSGYGFTITGPGCIHVSGFDIYGAGRGSGYALFFEKGAGGTSETDKCIWENNKIHDMNYGVKTNDRDPRPQYWAFRNNEFYEIRVALLLEGTYYVDIVGNSFKDYKEGVEMNYGDGAGQHWLVMNNEFSEGKDYCPDCKAGIILSANARDIVISGNAIMDSPAGILVPDNATNIDLTNVHINSNCIMGNDVGLDDQETSLHVLDAENNYWGCADGPGNPGCDTVSGLVNYDPWLGYCPLLPPTTVWVDDNYYDGGTNDGHSWGYDAFDTIQDGIDAVAGSTVYVAAGTYDEMVTINKAVTLRGANWGVHPAVGTHPTKTVGTRGPETIIKHAWYAFKLQADNVTIDGFKFTGEIGGAGQIIRTYADADNFHLTNCIFDVSREAVSSGWVLFGDGSHNHVLIDFNLFKDEQGHATLYFGGISPSYDRLRVAYNRFNAGGDGIFWATSAPMADGIVEGNEFDGTIGGIPGQGGTGMNIGKGGNIIIRDNWFHDMWYTGFQVGIVGGSVTDNTFEDTYPIFYYGAWYSSNAFELWGGEYGTAVSTNVTISGNTVKFNYQSNANADEHGIRLRSGADAPNIHVNCNNFIDGGVSTTALAARNQGSGILDAEYNWWGDASGPYHPTLNAGGTGGAASDEVDFMPWLLIAPPGGMCPPCLMTEFEIDHAKIDFKKKAGDDKVDVRGKLLLGPCSNGVDISQPVAVTVGPLSDTITMVEKGKKGDKWEYKRPKDGDGIIKHMTIDWKNGKFDIHIDNAGLTGVTNPVTISVLIGDDVGSETIQMKEHKHHWDYKAKKTKSAEIEPVAIPEEINVVAYPNPIRDVHTVTFQVRGTLAAQVEEIRVLIYDLSGRLVWEDAAPGSELDWHTNCLSGDYLANGMYLYRVQLRIDGNWISQDIGKIAVLR